MELISSANATSNAYCVIGAGPAGLTAIKNLRQRGLAVVAYEREDDVGGNWYYGRASSSVCASTHFISSKRLTEFLDYPMPKGWPPYPSRAQALEYLRGYADRFQLREAIRFQTSVERIEPANPGWRVATSDGRSEEFTGVVVANGHHWDPLLPAFPGEFRGQTMHARDYKTPDVLQGKRVLIVGAGNSGCDIAVEAAQHADAAFLSMRRGYHFLPKFLFGKPIDRSGEWLHGWYLPRWMKRAITQAVVRIAQGRPEFYGLPRPEHRLFETHPIVNSQLLYYAGHGKIRIKPNVQELAGDEVAFADGSREQIDLIVYATGYKLSLPFLDDVHLNLRNGRPDWYLNAFHRECDNLFIVGMIQPNGGLWPLADLQAQLVAHYLTAKQTNPERAAWFDRRKRQSRETTSGGIHYDRSPRHALEVEYFAYRDLCRRLLKKLM